mgnify:CR=1 FL=1|jgi:hypothetical protein
MSSSSARILKSNNAHYNFHKERLHHNHRHFAQNFQLIAAFLFITFCQTFALLDPPSSITFTWNSKDQLTFAIQPPMSSTELTGYQIIHVATGVDVKGREETITGGKESPLRNSGDNFKAVNCYDGFDGNPCCTNSNEKGNYYEFLFAPTGLPQVSIQKSKNKFDDLTSFDLWFKDESDVWKECPEKSRLFPEVLGAGPLIFACNTLEAAKGIKIIKNNDVSKNICMQEIKIFGRLGQYTVPADGNYVSVLLFSSHI